MYEMTNVQCVCSSNTTIFIGRIKSIFYKRCNYMFRRLIMAIFRLYVKYLLSSYTKHTWALYMGREGVKWARDLVSVIKVGLCGLHGGSRAQFTPLTPYKGTSYVLYKCLISISYTT